MLSVLCFSGGRSEEKYCRVSDKKSCQSVYDAVELLSATQPLPQHTLERAGMQVWHDHFCPVYFNNLHKQMTFCLYRLSFSLCRE